MSGASLVQAIDELAQTPEMAAVEIQAQPRKLGHVAVLPLAAGRAHPLDRPSPDVAELPAQHRDLLIRDVSAGPKDQLPFDVAVRVADASERLAGGYRRAPGSGQPIAP